MDNRKKGNKGEEVACKFIKKIGFDVIGRNYQKKWGEIDIIATKSNKVHFFEVKSVTTAFEEEFSNSHRPEDNVHGLKVKHIRRMIETFSVRRHKAGHCVRRWRQRRIGFAHASGRRR